MNPPPAAASSFRSALIAAAADRPGDDPIFALNAEALRRRKAGEAILNATLGALMEDDGRLAVMPVVREALAAVDPLRAAAYAPIAGEPAFLEAAVRDVFGEGPRARRAVAAATPGGTGALHHAIVNFVEPGQALLTTDYHWGPYETLAAHTGRRIETFPMFDRAGGFDLDGFARALREQVARQGRALVLLNTPCHNPTGYSLDRGEREDLAAIVREVSARGTVALLIDLAYAHFGAGSAQEQLEAFDDLGEGGLLLVAWTVSKAFAQYGARIGALLAAHDSEDERRRIANALSFSCRGTWSNCNHLGMLAITDLLGDPRKRARCEAERGRLIELLAQRVRAFNEHAGRAGLPYPRYEGGFFVTVFTADSATCARRMRDLGVYVVPMRGAVRVALCSTPAAEVPRLVEALQQGLAAAGG
jgi:aromatic-amino-acid transaminase